MDIGGEHVQGRKVAFGVEGLGQKEAICFEFYCFEASAISGL